MDYIINFFFVCKFDFSFGRMNIHVNQLRCKVNIKHKERELACHKCVSEGFLNNFSNNVVFYVSAVYQKGLTCTVATGKLGFAHNAVDLFTDCPSRERAGWLCDSFFTARAEYALFGSTEVEDAFLENFVLYKNHGEFPEGVLPMVYPSDPHENNKFIPQWNMWYVLEVCEYLTERRPDADRAVFWPSVEGILTFLARWENEFGLLEDLPSWNFVEWSSANDWTKNVNYPTNLLYAGVLEAAGETFGLDFTEKIRRIRREVLERAFDGEVFCDHAIRVEGQLVNQPHVSEACQYYAALFGGFDLSEPRFRLLRRGIAEGFPDRRESPDFCPVNAFIGMYLRMNVLANMGDRALLQDNIRAFFGGMCGKTGTLWEYKNPTNSLDHGFASYVLTLLDNR